LDVRVGAEAVETTDQSYCQQEVLRNMAGLRAQLARVIGSAELAADLLQDAVVTSLQKLRAGEIKDPARLEGYVYRVALNHLRNHRRKVNLHRICLESASNPIDQSESNRPLENLEADEWAKLANKLLQEVRPVRDRELLIRFYLHEESKETLCRVFGLTERHFNRVIYRARDRFRTLLEQRGLRKADFLSVLL